MLSIHEKLIDINQKVIQSRNEIYTDANKVESLVNSQNILLTIIEKLVPFIENNENLTFSSLSWNIIFNVLEMNEFSLENLCLKGIYSTN
uniref:Predicted protein n=1 Tax=Hordeum vulgare subsp. vulgare TaxID=112509 RepID=F2E019_HORVV|nr:predicted protein [Hordeum vulgare subsp. vulgare]